MDLNTLSGVITEAFNGSSVERFINKIWIFNEKCCVADFQFKGVKFALDLYINESGMIKIDLVDRTTGINQSVTSGRGKDCLSEGCDVDSLSELLVTAIESVISSVGELSTIAVSIVVPVYNREDLILNCLNSINEQTLNKNEFEVIFIDDNSTDRTVAAIEYNIAKDINFKVIKRTVGSGNASMPRNDGIKAANGRYVFFLDSDDTIHPDLLKDGIEIADKNNSDIVYFKQASSSGRAVPIRPFKKDIDKADIYKNHLFRSLKIFKFFRTSMLIDNNLLFVPSVTVSEDMIFMCQAIALAGVVSILSGKDYYILNRHDDDHLSKRNFSIADRYFVLNSCLHTIYFSNKDEASKSKMYNAWMIISIEWILNVYKKKNISEEDKELFFNMLSQSFAVCKDLHDQEQIYLDQQKYAKPFLDGDSTAFFSIETKS